jgi:hypothetical protein
MTKELNVFLLLPEANPLHGFFHDAYEFVEEESLFRFLKELSESMEWIYRERNAVSFYSSENIQRFIDNFEDFKDDYLLDPASKIMDILADAYNWHEQQEQEQNCAYFIWHGQTAHLVVNNVISEIAERQKNSPEKSFLLLNFYAASFTGEKLNILKEVSEDNYLSILPTFLHVDNVTQLLKWLVDNRQKRNFNLNPKHGENGIAAHNKSRGNDVSLLLCNRAQAQELLNNAIGDARHTTELYNFDRRHQKFIIFKFENETPQNQYHGYHPDNQDEVSSLFKQLIRDIGQV